MPNKPIATISLTRRLISGFAAMFLLSLFIGWLTWYNLRRSDIETQRVKHTYEVMGQARHVEKILSDIEDGRRGFRLTGNFVFMKPYEEGRMKLESQINRLQELCGDNAIQLENVDRLRSSIVDMMLYWRSLGTSTYLLPADRLAEITSEEKRRMDGLHGEFNKFIGVERNLLAQRQAASEQADNYVYGQLLAGIIVIEGIIVILVIVIRYEFRKRRQAEQYLEENLTNMQLLHAASDEKNWLLEGISKVKDAIQEAKDLPSLSQCALTTLLEYLQADGGAIYLLDEQGGAIVCSAGLGMPAGTPKTYSLGDGLPGRAALMQKTLRIRELPATYWRLESGAGHSLPGELLLAPFCYHKDLKGVIELASFNGLADRDLILVESISTNLAVAVNAMEASERVNNLLLEVRTQKEELEHQQEELRQTNEALTRQAEELQQSEEEMKVQDEELRQMNAELEKQNETLEATRGALLQQATVLEKSGRYKSEFLANMSHELRTPLNSILILARLMQESKDGPSSKKQQEYAQIIHKSGTDLLNLINDILDLSKIEAGKMELAVSETNIQDVAQQMRDLFSVVAAEKGIQLEMAFDQDIPTSIFTDTQKLTQILKNLLANALKFTNPGGLVTLSFSTTKDIGSQPPALCIAVRDNGVGIPKDKQHQIFQAFRQGDGATNRKFGGTGLGLSISRELARLLGASITVESQVGRGSIFTLSLPQLPPMQDSTQKGASGGNEKIRTVEDDRNALLDGEQPILIVEDDPSFAAVLRDTARESGNKVIVSLAGDEGWQYALQYHPKAIVLDLHLPGIDGWQFMQLLREDAGLCNTPVHIISAAEDALPPGPIAFLRKPALKEDLEKAFATLEQHLKPDTRHILLLSPNGAITEQDIVPLISHRGFQVVCDTVTDSAAAAQYLRQHRYDCLIADASADAKVASHFLDALKPDLDAQHIPLMIYMDDQQLSTDTAAHLQKAADVVINAAPKAKERLLDELEFFLQSLQHKPEKEGNRVSLTDSSFAGKKILVADDDMRNVFALSSLLEREGARVITATDGQDALNQLEQHPDIQLVLMDIMMPEMDGYEAIRILRKKPAFAKLPIITLTAKAMLGDREKSLAVGASDYITKPVDNSKLLGLMRVWLNT